MRAKPLSEVRVGIYDAEPDAYLPLVQQTVAAANLRICRDPDDLARVAADVDALLAFKFVGRPFPREVVLGLPRLQWVQLASAGCDHMLPFDPSQVSVTNASGIHGDTMAEYVIGSLVHMLWDFPRLLAQQRRHEWTKYDVPTLAGRTMGIVGAGHVGGRIGERARAFGMRVLGVRRGHGAVTGIDEMFGRDGLQHVLSASDVVVVTLPLTPETRGLIGGRELSWLRPGAVLVNVSRGGIVEEGAVLESLTSGRLAGAVLDVFAQEPLPGGSPFWDLPNVLVTPHIASEFEGWPRAVARLFCENLARWTRGEPLINLVDPALGY